MPEPELLLAIRQRIAERHQEFRRILAARPVRKLLGNLEGVQLSRIPRGFPADRPAADLLRYKYFILATSPKLYKAIVDRFRIKAPFLQFLTASFVTQPKKLDALAISPDERSALNHKCSFARIRPQSAIA